MKSVTMRKLRKALNPTFAAALLTMQLAPGFLVPEPAQAIIADGAPAIDVLGQFNPDYGDSMVRDFTRSGANGGPYAFGLSMPSEASVIDTVNHRLFISDTLGNRVVVHTLDSSNNQIDANADYVLGQTDLTSSVSGHSATGLYRPGFLAWDSSNSRLFVGDYGNNRVLVYDLSSGITNGMAASNVLGQADFTSVSANRGGSAAANTISSPYSLAWDSSNSRLFVADNANHRVLAYDLATIADGEPAVNVLGQANFTSASANRGGSAAANTLRYPYGLSWDSSNSRLFVADGGNNRILAYDLATVADGEAAVNVFGQANFTSTSANRGGSTAANTLRNPIGLAWDSSGSRLFASDLYNHRILSYDLATVADGEDAANVLGQADFTSYLANRGGAAAANTLNYPYGVSWDSSGSRLIAADRNNNRILFFDLATIADGEAAVDSFGQPSSVSSSFLPVGTGSSLTREGGNGGPFSFGALSSPKAVLVATSMRYLFVADTNNNRVLVYETDSSGIPLDRMSDYVIGQASLTTSSLAVTATGMYSPYGLAWDSVNSRLFVSDGLSHRVLVYDLSSGITDGMAASNILGQADFTSGTSNRGGSVAANTLANPYGLAWDSVNSRLFVSDYGNNRVLVYDLSSGITDGMNASNVLGQANFTSGSGNRGGSAAANTLRTPSGLAWDSANSRLFVSEAGNNRILAFDFATIADGEDAVNVLGQANFTSVSINRGGSAAANTLYGSSGLAWDSLGNRLFVGDWGNHRVLAYDLATVADGEDAVNVLGQSDFTSGSANGGGSTGADNLNYPYGVSWNSTNSRLLVADSSNNRILTFDVATAAGTLVATRDNKVTLSRLAAGASADFALSFDLAHTLSSTLTVTFPAGFTVTAAATTASSSSCLSDFSYTSNTLTANKTLCGGPITLGGATVTLPSTPGAYTITWVNDDPGSATVIIVGNDQISITAAVAPTVSFLAVAQPAASTCANTSDLTGSDYTLALGTLNVATITESESLNADSDTVERICTQGSTNATSGMAVTVKNANGSSGLVSSSVPADTIPSSASGQLAAGTPGYGVCVRGSSLASDSGLTPTGADPTATGSFSTYECETASGYIVALTGSAQGLWSAAGPTQDATAAIWVRVAISAVQPAHNDYADSLTFVATATY